MLLTELPEDTQHPLLPDPLPMCMAKSLKREVLLAQLKEGKVSGAATDEKERFQQGLQVCKQNIQEVIARTPSAFTGKVLMARKTAAGVALTRQRILAAATELFSQAGVTQATLERIAQWANVKRGAIYCAFQGQGGFV